MPELTMTATDEEFTLVWDTTNPIWKTGSKQDAQFFWLLGRRKELAERQAELGRLMQEVEDARS